MKLFLIRHGETKSNSEHRFIGMTDEELSEEGRNKLVSVKEKGLYITPDILFLSPMKRCRESAEILFPNVPYTYINEFKEIDFGIFEGKSHEELEGDSDYRQWINSGGNVPVKSGESKNDFIERTMKGFEKAVKEITELCKPDDTRQKNITILAHGGTIMAILSNLCDGDFYDYHINCGEGYECRMNIKSLDSVRISNVKKLC